jgi:DNA-binding CsgD family transcriptional regulator
MTRILYLPSESAFYTLDSHLSPARLIMAVNSGKWLPPAEIPRAERSIRTLRAVRLGRSTILIFRPLDLEQTHPVQAPAEPLGFRGMAVLQCVAEGMTTKQVAVRLGMSRRTVYMHLAAIRRSFSAISTAEAVRRAVELGLCQPPGMGKAG